MPLRTSRLAERYLRPAYRVLRNHTQELRIRARERRVRRTQASRLQLSFDTLAESLVVFFVPGAWRATGKDQIGGGVLSICAIYEESLSIGEEQRFASIVCTLPREPTFVRHTSFPNEIDVFRFEQLPGYFTDLRTLVLHVPEYAAADFAARLEPRELLWLSKVPRLQINILNQNIRLLPKPEALAELRSIAPKITMTTAHERYCTSRLRDRYAMPIHHLSVRIGPEQYARTGYARKEEIAVFSPDDRAKNEEVAALIGVHFPRMRIQVVKNLPYTEYRRLIGRAKWSFTFGEGLDYYFVESVFSGGIAFAVANDDFFTSELNTLRTVYSSFESLLESLADDIASLDHPDAYTSYNDEMLGRLSDHYSVPRFVGNLRRFHRGEYTFPFDLPGPDTHRDRGPSSPALGADA